MRRCRLAEVEVGEWWGGVAKAAVLGPKSKRLVGVMLMRLQLLFYSALSADQHVVLPLTHTQNSLSPSLTSFVVVDLPRFSVFTAYFTTVDRDSHFFFL